MYSSPQPRAPELEMLVRRFQERTELTPLKARALKRLEGELKAVYALGLSWKEIWRELQNAGYEGSYRQFVMKTIRLANDRQSQAPKSKNLPRPSAVKGGRQPIARESDRGPANKEKPAWQIQREETMARLDREAELNREREAQWQPKKTFKMTPFVGRGES